MESKILTPYAPILTVSTRALGYSFETALADIIDNSISKSASNININFSSNDPQHLAVIDDGVGMDKDELIEAMRYGSKSSLDERSETDLGRFGLGLKTASLSQCRKLTVMTKKNNEYYAACWDLDFIQKKEEWAVIIYEQQEIEGLKYYNTLKRYTSGTIVIWENFDKLSESSSNSINTFDEKMELARKHISLVFHRFLESHDPKTKITIAFNNDVVEPIDPFLRDNPATQPLSEHTFLIDNHAIKVKPYVLPHANKVSKKDRDKLGDLCDLRSNQGFYVYRNKRLIIWGTWFRLRKIEELNKLARIRVDIPNTLDSIWDIDVKKSRASLPDKIKKNLTTIVENSIGRSEAVYRYRGRKTSNDTMERVWDAIDNRGTIEYRVNKQLAIYKALENKLDQSGRRFLQAFINSLEATFPFEDVYYRIAKSNNTINNKEVDLNEIYETAIEYMYAYENIGVSRTDFFNQMKYMEYFAKYPEIINRLREEYDNEK